MKSVLLPTILILSSGLCAAQEMGRVISSTPVIQQVAQPRQVCANETVSTPGQRSGGGAAIGAIAGGALGNAVGHGTGRALATMLGIFGGAVVGDQVEGRGSPQYQTVQRCSTQTVVENRTTYYNVVYEYAGKQYNVQMPQDPGPFIQLQVTPVNTAPQGYVPPVQMQPQAVQPQAIYAPQAMYAEPMVVTSTPVISSYTEYYPAPSRPPVAVNLNLGYGFGYGGGGYHHHGGYWR